MEIIILYRKPKIRLLFSWLTTREKIYNENENQSLKLYKTTTTVDKKKAINSCLAVLSELLIRWIYIFIFFFWKTKEEEKYMNEFRIVKGQT